MTSVDSNVQFREHDIEFLQKRTRLWLQAVLDEKFEEQRSLADLVADGNILYRVAKYVIKDWTGKSPGPELVSPRAFSEAAIQGKNSKKYLPYSNVDTFLKMCRQLGLNDVDLFTPPDAVEGKDIRRVCVALRAVARRARAQHIRVPDFDDLSRPLPMPKEKVGEIKETLQHANSSPAVPPTAAAPEEDVQKSDRVQIISKFLSSTKSSPQGESQSAIPAAITSEPPPPDSPPSVGSTTPEPLSRDSEKEVNYPSTPAATLKGLNTPTLRKSQSAADTSSTQHLGSSYNFSPSPFPLFKPEWIPVEDLGLEELIASSEEVLAETRKESSESAQQGGGGGGGGGEPKLNGINPQLSRELKPSQSMKKSSSEAELTRSTFRTHDPGSKSSEAPPKLQSPSKGMAVVKSDARNPVATQSEPRVTASKQPSRAARANGSQSSSKEPAGDAKPMQINLNLRVWGPVIAGAVAFLGTLLAVRVRDPVVYEVKQGDTLTKISQKTGKSTWEELIKLNPNIKNPDLIYPSERLKLPV